MAIRTLALAALWCLVPLSLHAGPLAVPGNVQLRHDIELLVDAGVIDVPVSAWPIPWGDIRNQLEDVRPNGPTTHVDEAIARVRNRMRHELEPGEYYLTGWISGAVEPRIIRAFEDTPREDGEAGVSFSWTGERFTLNLSAEYANDPFDGDELRPDDTYLGVALGNWMLLGGWQQRWWGPGNDASLILSTNSRPRPGVTLQRNLSTPFETKWLSWLGPWRFTMFMEQLDDERVVNDALLWGARFSFRPLSGLEIGLSRTAQWCGDDRPCDLDTFVDLVLGKDNQGVNVDPDDEPGNQLGGIDIRWSLPADIPVALYMQWIGEDGRPDEGLVGSWLRQAGVEFWGNIGGLSHRTHVEWADTACGTGGFGSSEPNPNCAYNHSIYQTGYRYQGRPIGDGMDGDGVSFSLGSTLVQSRGHTWNLLIRYMEINRIGEPDTAHSLTATPFDQADVLISYERLFRYGRIHAGIGYQAIDDSVNDTNSTDVTGFIQWSTR